MAWLRNLFSIKAVSAILSSFGMLWLTVQITKFFFEKTLIFQTPLPDAIREQWLLFALAGFIIAAAKCRPRLSVSHKLNGRDITIEIAIADIFSLPGALIIGCNTTFDTRISRELISERSVQGVFTRKYYDGETQLDAEIAPGLAGAPGEDLTGQRIGKAKRYSMGHCVRLNPKQRTAYLLAIADINEHGVAGGTFDGLKDSLAKLWVFIGKRGAKDPLLIPVLGTGFGRLPQTREEVIRETIKSFIAACAEKTLADKLTIVITPQDMQKHRISFDELGSFLRHQCMYTAFSGANQQALGTPA